MAFDTQMFLVYTILLFVFGYCVAHLILLHFSFVSLLQPAPANPYPSTHLAPEKMGCKYFGVSSYLLRLQCGSLGPITRVCLLSLNCLCLVFGSAVTLFSLIKWCPRPPHHPPASFCVCVFLEAKIDKPGAALSECVCAHWWLSAYLEPFGPTVLCWTTAFTPNKQQAKHLFCTSQRDGNSDTIHFLLINDRRPMFTPRGSRRAVKGYLLRAFHIGVIIPISAISPHNNSPQCDLRQEAICTRQTQCHSPSHISNSNVMAAYCAVSRWIWKSDILGTWLIHTPPAPSHTHIHTHFDLPPHAVSNLKICNGWAQGLLMYFMLI